MNSTIVKAIKATLDEWEILDDYHKGQSYSEAKEHLKSWLDELEKLV